MVKLKCLVGAVRRTASNDAIPAIHILTTLLPTRRYTHRLSGAMRTRAMPGRLNKGFTVEQIPLGRFIGARCCERAPVSI